MRYEGLLALWSLIYWSLAQNNCYLCWYL